MKKTGREKNGLFHSKRMKIFVDSLKHAAQSHVCQVLLLQIVCTIVASVHYMLRFLHFIPLLSLIFRWKQFVFELLVIEHIVESKLGLFRWYSVVDDNLLLGAIPIYDLHFQELSSLDIKAVVSIVEPFELETKTLFGRPAKTEDWQKLSIDHIILPSPDFLPPDYALLEKGAKLLDKYLVNGQRVYIHCKAGRGRSASVVMMYFYMFRRLDMKSCFQYLKSKRALIFSDGSNQMNHLLEYERLDMQKNSHH